MQGSPAHAGWLIISIDFDWFFTGNKSACGRLLKTLNGLSLGIDVDFQLINSDCFQAEISEPRLVIAVTRSRDQKPLKTL